MKDRSTELLTGLSHSEQLPCSVKACRNPALPGSPPTDSNNIGSQTCAKHTKVPGDQKVLTYAGTLSISIVFVLCAICFFFSIIVYRLAAKAVLSKNADPGIASSASLLASLSASCIDIFFIVTLDKIYRKIAVRLTNWENHRTQEQFEHSLCTKVFCFEFVTYNATLLYLAFFKGNFYGFPGGT